MITEHAKLLSDGRLLVFCRDSNHCDMALRLILMKTVKCQWCGKRRGTVGGSVLKGLTSVVGLKVERDLEIAHKSKHSVGLAKSDVFTKYGGQYN